MQCGYCTPGWLTATAALLARVPRPDDERIAAELTNICRCGTYPADPPGRAPRRRADGRPRAAGPGPAAGTRRGRAAGPGPGAHAGRPWDLAAADPESFAAACPRG